MNEAKRMVRVPADVLERVVDLMNPLRGRLDDIPGRVKLVLRDEEYSALSEVRDQVGHYLHNKPAGGTLDAERATAFLLAVNDLGEEHGFHIHQEVTADRVLNGAPAMTVSFIQGEQPSRLRNRRRIGEEMRAALEGA